MFREREREPDRVVVLRFDDVLKNTEASMRLICSRIGLDFHPALVTAHLQREPIASNSLFAATEPGMMNHTPAERELLLSDEERHYLTEHCMPLYERAMRELVEGYDRCVDVHGYGSSALLATCRPRTGQATWLRTIFR